MPTWIASFLAWGAKAVLPLVLAFVVGVLWEGSRAQHRADGALTAQYAATLAESNRRSAAADALNLRLQDTFAARQVTTRTVIERIPTLVPDNRVCDLSPDALRLLNAAGGYGSVPDPRNAGSPGH